MPKLDQILWPLLYAGVLPALVGAALVAGICRVAGGFDAAPYCASAVALAAGLALGTWLNDDLVLCWPARFAREWLGWATFGALAVGMVARLPFIPPGVGWGLWGMASAHAGWLLTPAALREEFFWAPFALGFASFAVWVMLEEVGRLDSAGLVPLALAAMALTATVLLRPGSDRFALYALALAGSLAGVGIGGLVSRREATGVAPGVAVMLPSLILIAWHENFAEPPVPTLSFVLAAFSPLAFAPLLIPWWQAYQRKGLWAVQLLLLLAAMGLAIALAHQAGALAMPAEG